MSSSVPMEQSSKPKALISLSGGMDSTTVLFDAIKRGREVECVGFDYGSKHNPYELIQAAKVAKYCSVPFRVISLFPIMAQFNSNLMSHHEGAVPEGHYEASNMKLTVVPGRNMIFTSILAGIAQNEEMDEVWLGIHAGDHAIYPDCRPDFYNHMRGAVLYGTGGKIFLCAPFLHDTKVDIVKLGLQLGVPYELTRTCYKAQSKACGKCGSCQERLAAFKANGIEDPLEYESREILPKE